MAANRACSSTSSGSFYTKTISSVQQLLKIVKNPPNFAKNHQNNVKNEWKGAI